MRGVIAVTAAFAAVGCSIGALEGFSGGTGEEGDASSIDVTTNADVAAPTDAAASDADASTDGASQDCDGGAYLICATFDQGAVAAGFTGTKLEAGGTVGTSVDHVSAPFSMRAQLPAMTSPQNQYAGLYASWTGTRGLRVAFDLKIATPQWGASAEAFSVLHVLYPSTTNESYLFRAPDETTLSIEQNGAGDGRYQKVPDLPYDEWLRVTLEIVPATPTGTLRLRYDGVVVYESTSVPFDPPAASGTYVDVGLARFNSPSPAVDVLYDNVTIEQIP